MERSQLRAVFLDLDNTLIETRKADALACCKLSKWLSDKYSIPSEVCPQFLKAFRKCPDDETTDLETWRKLLWCRALGQHYNQYTDEIYKKWLQLRYDHLKPAQDVKNLLLKLRESYFLALITNGPSAAQWEKITKLNLKQYFDLILVSGDLPWEKPHPKIFEEACNFLGIGPHEAIMIGDKLHTDILGGIEAKMHANVWLPLNNQKLESGDPQPDFIIKKVTDLAGVLSEVVRKPKIKNRFLVSPDLEDCNSNSSDGS